MLTISRLDKGFAGRTLFADACLQVNRSDRIGLVGPNGAGKSTLFSLILGTESPDNGQIVLDRNISLGHLPQETGGAGDETVLEFATATPRGMARLNKQIRSDVTNRTATVDLH